MPRVQPIEKGKTTDIALETILTAKVNILIVPKGLF